MGLFDAAFNNTSIPSSGDSGSSGSSSGSSSTFPGSANNNAIQVVGGFKLDTAFLDAIYAGGKLTAAQRDAILGGADPSNFGLSQYDLNVLTVGRLGSRLITSTVGALVLPYADSTRYQAGVLVLYQPVGTVNQGLYQATSDPPVGTEPTDTRYWRVLVSAGPVVLFDQDIANPSLGAITAPASTITATQTAANSALPAITIPQGKRYRVRAGDPRPASIGSQLPSDSTLRMYLHCVETTDGVTQTVSLVITPKWQQIATASAAPIAAVSPATVLARATVELL